MPTVRARWFFFGSDGLDDDVTVRVPAAQSTNVYDVFVYRKKDVGSYILDGFFDSFWRMLKSPGVSSVDFSYDVMSTPSP